MAAMKRIVIFCDGTWNAAAAANPTNVVRIAQALAPVDTDDIQQVPIYVPGVGTGRRGVTPVGRWTDRVLGGALGLGFAANIVEAYEALVFMHEPRDEVFVFGFSRGAYAAWTLAVFLRLVGLLGRGDLHRLDEVVAWWRAHSRGRQSPDTPEAMARRFAFSPQVTTGPEDAAFWAAQGVPEAEPLNMRYLGLFDTVASLGVSWLVNRRDMPSDTRLPDFVGLCRHALALDERRATLRPTVLSPAQGHDDRLEQLWFAGEHGAVGGGGRLDGMSSIPLSWMIEGAERQGLYFDSHLPEEYARRHAPLSSVYDSEPPRGGLPSAILRRAGPDRVGPDWPDAVAPSAVTRWTDLRPRWRPGSLRRVARDLPEGPDDPSAET
ncbi:phospholipase effector Tle1 domain-containing protein [Jannaschia sp. KMU-145]|uniref:phospholipase effector Tle1 domain-containing protein n=1 Tax=Jannaschia halovivens TaxID=3388667 RepID=UPI00396AF8DC